MALFIDTAFTTSCVGADWCKGPVSGCLMGSLTGSMHALNKTEKIKIERIIIYASRSLIYPNIIARNHSLLNCVIGSVNSGKNFTSLKLDS